MAIGEAGSSPSGLLPWRALGLLTNDDIRARIERLEIPFDHRGVDPYGVSKKDLLWFFSALGALYRHYFTVTVTGIENVPTRGRAMLVCNHSGGIALDGAMVLVSLLLEMEPPRLGHGMAEKFLNQVPFLSGWTRRTGQLTGLPENAARLLNDDRVLMVFPEGARGTAKLYWERHTLVRFGTGFVRLAMQTQSPIVPLAFLGGGEAVPTVANLYRLGKLFGAPYIPVTPYLVPIPRPVPLDILYGEPLVFTGTGQEADDVISAHVETVRDRISQLLADGQQRRQKNGA